MDEKIPSEKSPKPHPIKDVLAHYDSAFLTRYGVRPNITGKDAALVSRLVKKYGVPEVLDRLAQFFSAPDPFFVQAGHSLGCFSACWNKLAAHAPRDALEQDIWQKALRSLYSRCTGTDLDQRWVNVFESTTRLVEAVDGRVVVEVTTDTARAMIRTHAALVGECLKLHYPATGLTLKKGAP